MSQETKESPLLKPYGKAMIDGNEWKDSTSYSQNGKKVPVVWETRFGHFRIVLLRRTCGGWKVFSYHPVTKEWELSSQIVCPEIAAHYATKIVIEWLRDLADLVENSGKYAATLINEKPPTTKQLEKTVLDWNKKYPIGTPVTRYKLIDPLEDPVETETISEAWIMGGHSVMVMVKGVSGGVLIESVIPR